LQLSAVSDQPSAKSKYPEEVKLGDYIWQTLVHLSHS
jgi:hypothetical protein